jgi:hypothetical protein
MNRIFVTNFEILTKENNHNSSGFQSTNFISHGNCYLTYVGNFLVVEVISNPTEETVENRFTVYNLDDIKTFRYTGKLENYIR